MVVTLDELERAGFITRRPDPHDRRARVVAPTAAGLQRLAQAEATIQRVEREALADLSMDDQQVLHRLLMGDIHEQVHGEIRIESIITV